MTCPVIPAIDILNGGVVRLTQGRYDQVEFYDRSPVDFAKYFADNGCERIHLVDLDGAKDGTLTNRPVFEAIRKAVPCELELGGGIRTLESANSLLDMGIDQLILGSLLIKNPSLAKTMIQTFPNQIIAGLDAKDGDVAIEGWIEGSGTSTASLLDALAGLPIHSIIYTDIAKDGTLEGPNLAGLEQICTETAFPIIASGGVGTKEHIEAIRRLNNDQISGVIVGKAILSEKIRLPL